MYLLRFYFFVINPLVLSKVRHLAITSSPDSRFSNLNVKKNVVTSSYDYKELEGKDRDKVLLCDAAGD